MKKLKSILFILASILVISCKKDSAKPVVDFSYTDDVDRITLQSSAVGANGEILKYRWSTSSDTVQILGALPSSPYIKLPILSEAKPVTIKLEVSNGTTSETLTKEIVLPKNTYFRTYGLGRNLTKEYSNNRNYNWYAAQYYTGTYQANNCGPTLSTMVVKWIKPDFAGTPQEARSLYKPAGEWWSTSDITSYLNLNGITNKIIDLSDINAMQLPIEQGNLVILCLDHYYLRKESNSDWHIDKFYTSSGVGAGHFIIIKGYKVVDNQVYYEAYDPGGTGNRYANGILKGRDRYYRSEDLALATGNWWKYAIVVSATAFKTNMQKSVNVNKIIPQSGG